MTKIVTHCDFPPIPVRSFDWCAHYEGCDEEGPHGHGATEAEAIADLTENYDAPMKPHFTNEWLRQRIESDPDVETEVGSLIAERSK